MIPPWGYLDEQDRASFRTIFAFLENRLADSATIEWALRLRPADRVQRIAVKEILDSPRNSALNEPWATAWRLIEESWSETLVEEGPSTAIYEVQRRLRAGDRSGAIISAIVNLVAPRLKVESLERWHWQVVTKPHRPKTFRDLLSARLWSGHPIDLNVLELGKIGDVSFLKALASALENAVNHGLHIGRRLGWDGKSRLWQLGGLGRVYYVDSTRSDNENRDPDAYHRGIAPSVKLLNAVVSCLAHLEPDAALQFVHGWRLISSPVHVRLWSAAAANPQLVSADQVAEVLLALDDREFWDLHVFPEIAELRAKRFNDLDQQTQNAIATRIRKSPPRDHWPKQAEADKVKNARLYWAVRELKRVEIAGGKLPASARKWLEARITQFTELQNMGIEEGFLEGVTVRSIPANADDRYDTLEGITRLRALEGALSASRGGWDDDPAERANDWLRLPEKTTLVLADLRAAGNGGDDFPTVWDRFGWAHSPKQPESAEDPPRDLQGEANAVLALLNQLSDATLSTAIEGVSNWLNSWSKQVAASPLGLPVWLRVWPFAVAATNAEPEREDSASLGVTATDNDRDSIDLDTLNPPAGKLVGVFLTGCPSLAQAANPFAGGTAERTMRDVVIAADGRSGVIARHRMIEELPYFLHADPVWTKEHLIAPLLDNDNASLALWGAIARRTHFTQVLTIIGEAMAERATDRRLGRETRQRLVFSLVVEALHAFREHREPAVSNSRMQQILRTLDDEVRAYAANVISQYVRDLSEKQVDDQDTPSATELFRSAAAPFLREVWPQERSLATPGVSGAFAALPATSEEAFAEAVAAIERFLVPFECWSMVEYGLYGEEGGIKKLSEIDDEIKAKAFLRLLDLTIGASANAVIPHDLTDALDQIRSVAPQLADSAVYRRLATAARR